MNVLIVDDDSIARLILRRILHHHFGATTVEATNGIEALLALQGSTFDLVILDLRMPEMDGLTVLRTIRAKDWLASLPVVVLTADRNDENVHEFIRLGVSAYLTKPLNGALIAERLAHILSPRQPGPMASNDHVTT